MYSINTSKDTFILFHVKQNVYVLVKHALSTVILIQHLCMPIASNPSIGTNPKS